jgi:hypothetical protein
MLRLFKNHEIDKEQWDECIAASPENIIYGLSWYLDIISPGWNAIIKEHDGRYLSVLPLTIKKKWGLPYLSQPFFSQQLGFFNLEHDETFIQEVLEYISKSYVVTDYNFHALNTEFLKNNPFEKFFISRITYILPLQTEYQQITSHYSANKKYDIKKALKHCVYIRKSEDFTPLLEMFRAVKGEEVKYKQQDYNRLQNLFDTCKEKKYQVLYYAVDKNNNKLAGGLFWVFQKKIIYIFSIATQEGRKQSAMSLILDQIIKEFAGSDYILDFEGGELKGTKKFFKDFGASPVPYFKFYQSKLPAFL